ncbi:hypothetical protein PYW07_000271 [Mythimna separata]|uniref:Uncharacterized protein n=1 Tax=Mythimna separata TaxID=271217 RepID=A0AAD7Z3J3_MYTSE|nr:hypothetical protein PYW07_000271 [Mythimna separata]
MANADFRKDVTMPVRPRSVYTAHSYNQEESNLSAFQDYSKFLEGGLGQAELVGAAGWQPPWRAPLQRKAPFYPGDDIYHADTWRELEMTDVVGGAGYNASVTPHGTVCLRLRDRVKVDMTIDGAVRVTNAKNNIILALSRSGAAAALIHPNGRVYHYGSRVEIQARHQQGNNKYAKMWYKGVSFTAEQCALVYLVDAAGTRTTTDTFLDMSQDFTLNVFYNESRHGPSYVNEALSLLQAAQYWLTDDGIDNWIINNVRVSQTADGLVRPRTDSSGNSESRHGPSYVNEALSLLQAAQYWLTDDGIDNWIINNVRVSQTADGLVRPRTDSSGNSESRHGPSYVNEALSLLQAAQYWLTDDGIDNWIINNVRVSQTADGLVRIHRCSHKYQLRTSPSNGSASITSPFLHCTASLGQTQHLFVRRGERRMHFDGNSFIVRNAGHSAGFDDKNQLKVY